MFQHHLNQALFFSKRQVFPLQVNSFLGLYSFSCLNRDNDFNLYNSLVKNTQLKGLLIAPGRVQMSFPWKYLGCILRHLSGRSQKIKLNTSNLYNLKNYQKLLGDIIVSTPVCPFSLKSCEILFLSKRALGT